MVAGCFRHCRQHDPHGRAAGQPCARYGGAAGGWGQASHGRRGATIYSWLDKLYWRLQVPHTYAFRCIWQRQQPAAILRRAVCDPRLSPGRRGIEDGGRVFPALSARRHSRKHRSPAINTSRGTQRQRTPFASLGLAEPQTLVYRSRLTSMTASLPFTPVVGHIHQLWVVASHTPTRYLDYPAILRVYPHTTRWP